MCIRDRPCLTGKKLLLCETAEGRGKSRLVAVDLVGAGPGSQVLVSRRYGGSKEGDYIDDIIAVSYTHLDVYKRQQVLWQESARLWLMQKALAWTLS